MTREIMSFYPVVDSQMEVDINNFYQQDYMQRLKSIRPGYIGACRSASIHLSKETGLKLESGTFRVDIPSFFTEFLYTHWWCKDGLGRIVDPTAFQFNRRLYEPLPEGILIINADNPLYSRYTERDFRNSIEEEIAMFEKPKKAELGIQLNFTPF